MQPSSSEIELRLLYEDGRGWLWLHKDALCVIEATVGGGKPAGGAFLGVGWTVVVAGVSIMATVVGTRAVDLAMSAMVTGVVAGAAATVVDGVPQVVDEELAPTGGPRL